jgi:hypothetical protein
MCHFLILEFTEKYLTKGNHMNNISGAKHYSARDSAESIAEE